MQPQEHDAIVSYLGPIAVGEASDLIIRQIPTVMLGRFWPQVLGDIERVVERTRGRWTVESVAEHLLTGAWQLWIVWDGAVNAVVATEIFHEASGMKNARAVFVGGRDMGKWAHLVSDLEDWARSEGCTRFEMIISKGIAKHFPDYRMSHVLLEKDL